MYPGYKNLIAAISDYAHEGGDGDWPLAEVLAEIEKVCQSRGNVGSGDRDVVEAAFGFVAACVQARGHEESFGYLLTLGRGAGMPGWA